jgi:hypothetical protein
MSLPLCFKPSLVQAVLIQTALTCVIGIACVTAMFALPDVW